MSELHRQDKAAPSAHAAPGQDITAHENRDPLTGEPGAHPLGTGIGAMLGGAAGAAGTVAAGALLGPAGVAVGLALGAVAGGYAGKGAAEALNPTEDEPLWREHFEQAGWGEGGEAFGDYEVAFRLGQNGYHRFLHMRFEEVERDLEQDYMNGEGRFGPPWSRARQAARAAWDMEADKALADPDRPPAPALNADAVDPPVRPAQNKPHMDQDGQRPASDGPDQVSTVLTPLGERMPIIQPPER